MSDPLAREARRRLVRIPVPPGVDGPTALLPHLVAALDGSGPAVAPIPTVTTQVSNEYVTSLLRAVRADESAGPLEADDVAVVMATSGSTGEPRGVLLTAGQLTALTTVVNGPGRRPQWIAALPVTSMGGLNVLVRAIATDRPPIALPSLGGAQPFTPRAFHAAVEAAAGASDDVRVSLVPAQLARLLADDAGIAALRGCASVLVGGGATRESLRTTAEDLEVRITSTYGATETSGGCVFDGFPLPGVVVSVASEAPGTPGILTIAGPSVASGYRGEPAATGERFGPRGFITSDLGTVAADGRVTVIGRADDIVVIKGTNVSPGAVERVISDLPDVVAAAAVVTAGPEGEPIVAAFIEVRDGAAGVSTSAAAAVVSALGTAARPAAITEVAHLPHLPNGKVDRRLLVGWARDREGLS
ncbi:MAG: AMP-binding protein [Actinobacteria bacterium]|jgi:O-succinylbenzoic acid--CoA ligase|nr:AMP-binding protein [Actinomycetota bacterium]